MNSIKTGTFIRSRRKLLNLSQSKLAEMLGVEPQTVSKWERGLGMPDYDNLDKLKEIFNCSLLDLLEPETESFDNPVEETEQTKSTQETLLPVLSDLFNSQSNDEQEKFNIFDFLNKRKLKELLERLFGYEYANTFNKSFLFKNLFKRRTKEDYENTLSQGMFRNKMNRNVIGIEAPWLYLRILIFLFICSGISFISACIGFTMPFIIIGGLFSSLPLLIFLFESNFSRNLSIFEVLIMFVIGGLSSLLLTLVTTPIYPENTIVQVVLLGPVFEEISKAIIAVVLIAITKPNNMLTGLLIGFSVGAGFDFFENVGYAYSTALQSLLEGIMAGSSEIEIDILVAPIVTIIIRTLFSFFSGHHYYTAIFSAIYVLFKKNTSFDAKELFNWKPMSALLASVLLHSLWNASTCVEIPILSLVMMIIDCILCISALIVLINIGISQTRIAGIYEEYQSSDENEKIEV